MGLLNKRLLDSTILRERAVSTGLPGGPRGIMSGTHFKVEKAKERAVYDFFRHLEDTISKDYRMGE